MTDPAWGLRVLGFGAAVVIVALVGLDRLPQAPSPSHLTLMGISLVSAVVFPWLPPSRSHRVLSVLLVLGPLAGSAYVAAAMRVVDSPVSAMSLALLQLWFVTFCALYGRRWHTASAVLTTGPAVLLGLWGHVGARDAATFALTAVAVLAVSSLILTAVSEQVRRRSTTDDLTGALSRHGLFEQAPVFTARARSRARSVGVVVLDLDGFKPYNDVHGHAAGDALLTAAVAAWRAVLPAGSLLARTGGDEFVAVVTAPGSGPAVDQQLLSDLRRAAPEGVRASAGSATWTRGTTLEAATHEADRAMYLDKGERRRSTDETRGAAAAGEGPGERAELP